MKKLLLVLFLVLAASYGFNEVTTVRNSPVIINETITPLVINKAWKKIRSLDRNIDKDAVIDLYFNSYGGDTTSTVVMMQRIIRLKKQGRKFRGTVYGVCFSSCASLFSLMTIRYMTDNAVYNQHRSFFSNKKRLTVTDRTQLYLTDVYRLKYDAKIAGFKVDEYINLLDYREEMAPAKTMLSSGAIHGIVPQPDIDEI